MIFRFLTHYFPCQRRLICFKKKWRTFIEEAASSSWEIIIKRELFIFDINTYQVLAGYGLKPIVI